MFNIRNYDSFFCVMAGLNNHTVRRLKNTWRHMNEKLLQEFRTLAVRVVLCGVMWCGVVMLCGVVWGNVVWCCGGVVVWCCGAVLCGVGYRVVVLCCVV